MAEMIASTILKAVIQKLAEETVKQVGRVKGICSELESLEETLSHFQDLLVDASQKEIKQDPVQNWVNKLKHLVYDIDDILDDLATDAMRPKYVKNSGASTSKVRKLIVSCCTNLSLCTKTYRRLDKIKLRLQELEKERTDIGLKVENGGLGVRGDRSKDKNRVLETSLVDVSSIVGRQGDKDELIDKLLGNDPRNKNFSIVPIVGMGGVGKTTLAKIVYNDERVKSHFELKGWVCVSDEWDSFQISKSIFQSVGGEDKKFENFNLLQEALVTKLGGKKFLLVLDDVWTESYKDWETLVRPFSVCAPGSKVIITTRKDQLLQKLDCGQPKQLQCLSHDDAVSLFCQNALNANNFDLYPTLKVHGEYIVGKCKGLPLALIALGRLLRRKDEEGWKEMVDSEIWSLKEDEEEGGGILNSLKLSYHELPASLKQLFAYCSLFPKDALFEKDDLVLLWMAEGFLHQSDHSSKTEERLGHDYFEELLSRSFFQQGPDDKSLFVMHDLMHDLATSVAGEFFFRLEKDMATSVAGELRHMSFVREEHETYEKFMVFKKAYCLRTLRTFLSVGVTKGRRIYFLPNDVLADLLPQLPLLRVINLSNCMIREVPKCIGSLKHLRYINFSRTDITNLPETVCDLCNLQTLIVFGCESLTKLPNVSKLKNLRHLDLRGCPSLVEFSFKGDAVFPCLKELCIEDCPKLVKFSFKGDKVFPCLKELCIKEFPSLEDFSFEGDKVFSCLKVLHIIRCPSLVKVSFKGDEVFPFLQELRIERCSNLLQVSAEALPSLRVLSIEECGDGVLRSVVRAAPSVTDVDIRFISGLTNEVWRGVILDLNKAVENLNVWNCDEIRYLRSKVLVNLRTLRVWGCGNLVSLGEEVEEEEEYSCGSNIETLEISYCDSITCVSYLTKGGGQKLKSVIIQGCGRLILLKEELGNFIHLTSLTDMVLMNCPNVDVPTDGVWPPNLCKLVIGLLKKPISEWGPQKFPSTLVDLLLYGDKEAATNWSRQLSHLHLPSSLTRLEIRNFKILETVSEGLRHLTSLQHLYISGCPKMKDLPETLLPSLLSLQIRGCPILKERCSEGGSYWPQISHIPNIEL